MERQRKRNSSTSLSKTNSLESPTKKRLKPLKISNVFNSFRFRNILDFRIKKGFRPKIVIFGSLFLIFVVLLLINTYKNDNFRLNELNAIDKNIVYPTISKYLESHTYFGINPRELSDQIKTLHPLIEDVDVNKTLFRGLIIEIKEHKPISIIRLKDKQQKFFTEDEKLIDYKNVSKSYIILNFSEDSDKLDNSTRFIEEAVLFITQINKLNVVGQYTFDNFGNLTIDSIDNQIIKADLNERYHSIDEQIKVFQNALEINTFREIDLRFKDLITRKL